MADPINSGTGLIEENALMPESSRFESEPWTSFYMAGEIIRESRNASGKQSQYAREGNPAQSDKVIDHYNHAHNAGGLSKDNLNVSTGLVGASECGHLMELQMNIKSETQVAEEADFGFGSATASSSLPAEWVTGKTSRRHWPSRTRISPASSASPRATLRDATWYFGTVGRPHLVVSRVF
ncbi:MAG: iron-sulfur cluster assembly scaffold protein [Candidatus Acidiferrales bacterium]